MRRAFLPRWRPPYRDDFYQIWLEVMKIPPKGDLRAKELYLKSRTLALVTKENLSELVWSFATFHTYSLSSAGASPQSNASQCATARLRRAALKATASSAASDRTVSGPYQGLQPDKDQEHFSEREEPRIYQRSASRRSSQARLR